MQSSHALSGQRVGEAHAYVQGATLKAWALSSESFELPGSDRDREEMRKILTMLLGEPAPDDDWSVQVFFTDKTLAETGEQARGLLARKEIDGEWVYRRPTPTEESDYVSGDAW